MPRFEPSTTSSDVVAAFPEQVAGKTFVITGVSTGGLGASIAVALAKAKPAAIILLGRTESKVSPVVDEIEKISPSTKAHFVNIELASTASVRTAAPKVAAVAPKIDVLINNAGIMGPKYSLTPDGVESQFGVNHIGHFLLTNLLTPQLFAAGNARVVNVSSQLYQFSPILFSDYNFVNTPWNTWEAYGQSKTANILFAVALAKRLKDAGVKSFSLHPGNIQQTGLSAGVDPETWPVVMKMFGEKGVALPKEKTIDQGGATTLAAALNPELDNVSGAFLDDCKVAEVKEYASSEENAEKLWALSEKIVGEKFSY